MLLPRLRAAGFVGTGIAAGCIWPLVLFCALVIVSWGLWDALDWPDWILCVGFVLLFIGLDAIFFLMLLVAFIAGFFVGAWEWSLALPGLIVFAFAGNVVLGLVVHTLQYADSVEAPRTPEITIGVGTTHDSVDQHMPTIDEDDDLDDEFLDDDDDLDLADEDELFDDDDAVDDDDDLGHKVS